MGQVDFVDRLENALSREQFKDRLSRILIKRGVELIFVRWKDPAWLLVVKYKDGEYTLRAKIDQIKRSQFSIGTIKHLKDRVVFWKDLMDENERFRPS